MDYSYKSCGSGAKTRPPEDSEKETVSQRRNWHIQLEKECDDLCAEIRKEENMRGELDRTIMALEALMTEHPDKSVTET